MRAAYYGNGYIGLFGKANDKLAFLPRDVNKGLFYSVHERIGVGVVKTTILGSNLIGVYMALGEGFAVVPDDILPFEEEALSSHIEVVKIKSRFNAWGNNITIGKNILANPHLHSSEVKAIEDALGKEVFGRTIAGYSTVGSMVCRNSKGFVIHYKASDEEVGFVEKVLGVKGTRATTNMGNGFVSIGLIANSKGYVVGEGTTGIEIARIEEGLGYLEG